MTPLYTELYEAAITVLDGADQADEFKRRFLRLLENATTGNLTDDDVRGVILLASADASEEE